MYEMGQRHVGLMLQVRIIHRHCRRVLADVVVVSQPVVGVFPEQAERISVAYPFLQSALNEQIAVLLPVAHCRQRFRTADYSPGKSALRAVAICLCTPFPSFHFPEKIYFRPERAYVAVAPDHDSVIADCAAVWSEPLFPASEPVSA